MKSRAAFLGSAAILNIFFLWTICLHAHPFKLAFDSFLEISVALSSEAGVVPVLRCYRAQLWRLRQCPPPLTKASSNVEHEARRTHDGRRWE